MAVKLKITGTDKLQKKIMKMADKTIIKDVVKRNTAQMQEKTVSKAVYAGDYTTGATRQSVKSEILDGGYTGAVGMGMEYDPYLETGTRFMAAQPALTPSFKLQSVKFIKDLGDIFK